MGNVQLHRQIRRIPLHHPDVRHGLRHHGRGHLRHRAGRRHPIIQRRPRLQLTGVHLDRARRRADHSERAELRGHLLGPGQVRGAQVAAGAVLFGHGDQLCVGGCLIEQENQ